MTFISFITILTPPTAQVARPSSQHPYKVQDVYEAANFILQEASAIQSIYMPPTMPVTYDQPSTVPATEISIKKEDLASLFVEFTKTLVGTVNHNQIQQSDHECKCCTDSILSYVQWPALIKCLHYSIGIYQSR